MAIQEPKCIMLQNIFVGFRLIIHPMSYPKMHIYIYTISILPQLIFKEIKLNHHVYWLPSGKLT